jgi:caspase domain-containing protein
VRAIKDSKATSLVLGLLSLFAAALLLTQAAYSQERMSAPARLGILGELAGGSFRMVGCGTRKNVIFVEWELPNRVYSMTTIFPNRRVLDLGTIKSDGSFHISSSIGVTVGRIREDGSLISEGVQSGRRVVQETTRLGPNFYSLAFTIDGGRRVVCQVERIPPEEARRMAARLYPAEYGQKTPSEATKTPKAPSHVRPTRVRNAFVVGIGTYSSLPDLANPANDARAVAKRLTAIGYHVELIIDPTLSQLYDVVARLRSVVEAAPADSPIIFYYAGHAVEIGGRNYLLPSDLRPDSGAEIDAIAVPVDSILEQMALARKSTRVVILDACRNAPARWPNAGRGLAQLSAPEGTFIAYSTAPGMVAADGIGRNSPFAGALVEELSRPSQPIEVVFRKVRRAVLRQTEGGQIPWDSSSLLEQFSFN